MELGVTDLTAWREQLACALAAKDRELAALRADNASLRAQLAAVTGLSTPGTGRLA